MLDSAAASVRERPQASSTQEKMHRSYRLTLTVLIRLSARDLD